MSRAEHPITLKLDPWATSSLLQKAIRRSEVELALHAARELYRYRGKAVFRRLLNVAFEDVGIANPELVAEVTFLTFDKQARAMIGSDLELILDLAKRLALSPKDRSTDYLVCSAIKSAEGKAKQAHMHGKATSELIGIIVDPQQPLLRRACAALVACTAENVMVLGPTLRTILGELDGQNPSPLHGAVEAAAKRSLGSYILMAPLLWLSMQREPAHVRVIDEELPATEYLGGIPLYTFDKHTSVGKRAISRLFKENAEMRRVVLEFAAPAAAEKVAAMAAFYADAVPIKRRLEWALSPHLRALGCDADMVGAGCDPKGVGAALEVVDHNLPQLGELRLSLLEASNVP